MAINRAKISRAAEKHVRQGRLDDAIREYRRLLADSPDDLGTLNKIGDLYKKAGQVPRAVASFRRIAEHYRDRGFGQKAIAMFKKVAKLSDEDVGSREALAALYTDAGLTRDALHNLREAAHLLSLSGDTERALELESRALELCPDDWSGLRFQAERLQTAGEFERAVATYLRAAAGMAGCGDLDGAVDCCRDAVSAAPLDPEPIAHLVRLLVRHDREAAAVEELHTRLAAAEDEAPHLHALLGETLLARGDLQGASEALEKAASSAFAAGDVGYRLNVLRLDLLQGRTSQVEESLAHMVELMREVEDTDGAVRLLMEVHEKAPDRQMAAGLLLEICRHGKVGSGLLEPSLDLLAGALSPGEHEQDLVFVLGRLSELRPGDKEVASRLLDAGGGTEGPPAAAPEEDDANPGDVVVEGEDGSDVEPDFVNELLVEADVFIKYGLMAKAAAHLAKILERYPRTLVAHQRLVEIYDETGQVEANVLQAVQLAEIHRQRGEIGEARQTLTRAHDLQPDNHSLGTMLKVLAVDRPLPAYQSTFPDARPAARASQRPTPAPATVVPVQATPPQTEAAKASPQPQASAPPAPPAVENEEEVLDLVMDAEPAGEEPAPPRVAAPQVAAAAPDAPAPLEAPVARTAPADQVPQASPPARVAPDAPSPAPEPEPPNVAESLQASAGADDDGGDFFDLAAAIERELSVDAECVVDTPVVDDGGKEVDTITGIRQAIDQQVGADDFQTHYQLGIAFKEMGLLDEAIGEFQQAARDPDSFMTCCSMLGLCFREKGMPQIAEKWYRKGLDKGGTGDSADEHALGLLYDMGTLHQEQGRHEEARNCFVEVYASNANYLDVATRLKLLSAEPDETAPRAGR